MLCENVCANHSHHLSTTAFHVFDIELFCICTYRPDKDLSRLTPIIGCTFIAGGVSQDRSDITGPCWDPYWLVSVLSPILFILLIMKAILLTINDVLFRKFFIIHILAVIVSSYTVVCSVECYMQMQWWADINANLKIPENTCVLLRVVTYIIATYNWNI